MWNLKKWYKWTYSQNRNRVTDGEEKLTVPRGKRGVRINWEIGDWRIHTTIYKTDDKELIRTYRKMLLWKCCTQYASKSGKLSRGHRTRKGQFSFQSQRKAMPKNAQTTTQLHSFHTLSKKCSKISKPGFNNTWTMNYHMFKLFLEKAEEPEIKLPTSTR